MKGDGSFSRYTFDYAAQNGNLCNMKWLHKNWCEYGVNTFEYAAGNGYKNRVAPPQRIKHLRNKYIYI